MKKIFLLVTVLISINSFAQQKAFNQKQLLSQYIGNWVSTDNINDDRPGLNPNIKMSVIPKMDSGSLQVEVYQQTGDEYKQILVELISYDAATDQIVAAGQNAAGQCFTGKGFFDSNNKWVIQDHDFKGEPTVKITFNFISSTAVLLKGEIPNAKGWEVKYIKVN
jgi:hypothetical protein